MKRINHTLIVVILLAIVLSVMLSSCKGAAAPKQEDLKETVADTLLKQAEAVSDERWMAVADSLLDSGVISVWEHARERCSMIDKQGNLQKRIDILRDAIAQGEPDNVRDSVSYYFCVSYLAYSLGWQDHFEEALRTATSALEPVKSISSINDRLDLLSLLYDAINISQAGLNMMDEAEQTAEEGYGLSLQVLKQRRDKKSVMSSLDCVNGAIMRLQANERYEATQKWLMRSDSLLKVLMTFEDRDTFWTDIMQASNYYFGAITALGLHHPETGDSLYKKFLKTDYAQEPSAGLMKADYLYQAKRWGECADLLSGLEDQVVNIGRDKSLKALSSLAIKFTANYNAGRRDTAMKVAHIIIENLDSAIIRQQKSTAAELATIYETQKKDVEIAQQKTALTQQRLWGAMIGFGLIALFLTIYLLYYRYSQKHMARLRGAQERIEKELQIARDIQMSMLPSTFPDYEGLDMYASMNPAREVGGDLYGYVLQDDKLYFALGDVSGKGVPASLFMAQATRLFRTLAAQGMMPADICIRMNDALSGEDNVNGMFVTLFLGLIDLKTGHLDFCNAGHNPPVIGGGEHHGDFLNMIPNAPIGLWPGLKYEGEEIENIKNRPLFIYTDGLNEAENRQQEQFGDERLLDILRHTHFETAQQVIDTLKAVVEQHRNGAESNDDLTMMCIRVK